MTGKTRLRHPVPKDGNALYRLIEACPPLDLNSAYLYFLLCDHYRDTCVVAECDGRLLGAVTAYRPPVKPDTLFIWQVAVHADARGQGLGKRMLTAVAGSEAGQNARWLETTVSPSNTASRRLFASWARDRGVTMEEQPYLEAEDFPGTAHEAEPLLRIPLTSDL